MNRIPLAIKKVILLDLAWLLILTACGESINSLRDEGDVQGLITILENQDEKIATRTEAALALGVLGDPSAVEPLILYLQECNEIVADTASTPNDEWGDAVEAIEPVIAILGSMGDLQAVEPLLAMLDNYWGHDGAVQALGLLGDPRAIVPLIDTLDHGMGQFTQIADRVALHRPVVLALVAQAPADAFTALSQALPGFHLNEDSCAQYSLTFDALMATQDPRLEALLVSEMQSFGDYCEEDLPYRLAEYYNHDPAKLLPFLQSDFSGTIAQIYYSLTPKPQPIAVDFATVDEYPRYTEVRITGRVSVGFAVVCEPDCFVYLGNPANNQEKLGLYLQPHSQMASLPNGYEEKDFAVFLDNGASVGNNALIRVTGTICSAYTSIHICDVTTIEPAE